MFEIEKKVNDVTSWCYSIIRRKNQQHLGGQHTTKDCTISKVTSELLIVSTCWTKTFLLWNSTLVEKNHIRI